MYIRHTFYRSCSPLVIALVAVVLTLMSALRPASAQTPVYESIRSINEYFMVGHTSAPDSAVIYCGYIQKTTRGFVVKIDASGNIVWSKKLISTGNRLLLNGVTSVSDGSLMISGTFEAADTNRYPILIHISTKGDLLWAKSYQIGIQGQAYVVQETKDGGFTLCGSSQEPKVSIDPDVHSDGLVFKVDRQGQPLWCNAVRYPKVHHSYVFRQSERSDSSIQLVTYIVSGKSIQARQRIGLVRLSCDGALRWQKVLFCADSDKNMFAEGIIQARGGGSMIAGGMQESEGLLKPLLLRLDDSDRLQRANTYSFFISEFMQGFLQDPDGSLVGLAYPPFSEDRTFHLLRIDTAGVIRTGAQFDVSGGLYGMFNRLSGSSGLYSIGTLNLANVGMALEFTTCNTNFESCNSSSALASVAALQVRDTNIDFSYDPLQVSSSPLLIRQEDDTVTSMIICSSSTSTVESQTPVLPSVAIFPNPASSSSLLIVQIQNAAFGSYTAVLFDLTGKELFRSRAEISSAQTEIQLPTGSLPSGTYLFELVDASTGSSISKNRVIVQ